MAIFQHVLWGYELTYPDEWVHQTQGPIEAFAAIPEALTAEYSGPNSGQILMHCEWNCPRQALGPIWNQHMGMLASWVGAQKVGSAPWSMGGAQGIEADFRLAKKDPRRLWAGVLERGYTVLKFVVLHLKEERATFEPMATRIISSLRFPAAVDGVNTGAEGLPLPPDYRPIPPQTVIDDIADLQQWRAYEGTSGVDALQAFYLREAPNFGWEVTEYAPFPGPDDLGFARLRLEKDARQITLGILPHADTSRPDIVPGRLVLKLEPGP